MTDVREKTILVIDDETAIRQSFTDYLEDLDYRILAAENGRIGVTIFDKEEADLVLVDLRMPEMDGLEVLAHIKERRPDTPLIVVSGTGVIDDAVEALHQGAWDYILKPVKDLSVLGHAVEMALEKARLKRENRNYQKRLERMVAERTAELEEANEQLRTVNSRLRRIVDTTRSLSFCSRVEDFGSRLLDEFGQHMLATGGSLYMKKRDGFRRVHSLDPGQTPEFIPFPVPDKSVFQQAINRGKPLLIQDIAKESEVWGYYKGGSALIFPLPDESGEITAVLTMHSNTPPFVEQDREIGSILASYGCEAMRAVRATESLQESERQLRSILDNIRAGIVISEISTRKVVYVNPAAVEMIGAPHEKILGLNCHELFCSENECHCPIFDFGQAMETAEITLKFSEGRRIPVLRTVTRTAFRGEQCLLESFVDLTAQKAAAEEKSALEAQLRQAQKMEALGTLAGGIAHDFNNILGAIIGYSELIAIDLDDPGHPNFQRLKSILHAGNRAKELVTQILTFSRMQEHLLAPIRIAPIVKEALKLLKASLPATIQLETRITAKKQVMADATQIHQVIMNLCTNAYHAMEGGGGTLTVSLESVLREEGQSGFPVDLPPGNYLKLSVEDSGSGISPSVVDNIFDPYFSTKSKSKGTGLGLAVVHGIVKSHGGVIDVTSEVGKGTAFHVFLPETDDDSQRPTELPAPLPRGTERILLIDDEKDLVDIGCRMLEYLGYDVTGVVGSTEALKIFQRHPQRFDLVVTDMNMPVLTGDRLAQEIHRIHAEIPILLCTGFSDRVDQKRVQAAGVRKIVMKPLAMNILAEAVREVLDGE